MLSLLFVLAGVAAGMRLSAPLIKVERFSGRALDALLLCLVFSTSLTFGLDPNVSRSLGSLGLKSLLSAVLSIAGSVCATALWGRAVKCRAASTPEDNGSHGTGDRAPSLSPRALSMAVLTSAALGWALGLALSPSAAGMSVWCGAASTGSLWTLLVLIGYDLGKSRVWRGMREYGILAFTLPLAIAGGTLAGSACAGLLTGVPFGQALSAGSGFGWYSMAGATALRQAGAETGAYVFLSNLWRELLTVALVPFLPGTAHPALGAAMGGATAMDSTLPAIKRSLGDEAASWGLISGTTLSALSPLALSLFLRMCART